jgi:WD40 repeat protein
MKLTAFSVVLALFIAVVWTATAAEIDAREIAQLIEQMDSDSFEVRRKAHERLEKLGEEALPALREAAARAADLELHNRLDALAQKIEQMLYGERRRFEGHQGPVFHLAVSSDGKRLVSSGGDKTARVWDVNTGETVQTFTAPQPLLASAFSRDGKHVLSGGGPEFTKKGSYVGMWDVATGKEVRRFGGHDKQVVAVGMGPGNDTAVSASMDGTMRKLDLDSGRLVRKLVAHEPGVRALAVSPNGKWALSCGHLDEPVRLWDLESSKEVMTFKKHTVAAMAAAFSSDGKRLLLADTDASVHLWDMDTGKELLQLSGHYGLIYTVAFTADGRRALTGGQDRTVRLWDLKTGKELHVYRGHTGLVTSVCALPDGGMVSTGLDSTIRLWNVPPWKPSGTDK